MPPEQPPLKPLPPAPSARGWPAARRLGPIVGLVLLCIAGTLLNSDFATVDNAMNVLTRTAFIGIIAVGMCFVIISGGIDLSVGSMAALIAGAVILLMNALGERGWTSRAGGRARHGLRGGAGRAVRAGARPADHARAHRAVHRHARHARHLPRLPHLLLQRRRDHARQHAGRCLRPGLLRQPARRADPGVGVRGWSRCSAG